MAVNITEFNILIKTFPYVSICSVQYNLYKTCIKTTSSYISRTTKPTILLPGVQFPVPPDERLLRDAGKTSCLFYTVI